MIACRSCGGDADRGWTDGAAHDCCAPCMVASIPTPPKGRVGAQGIDGTCACCGLPGAIVALGLRRSCYQARYRHGLLAEWRRYLNGAYR